MWITLLSFNRYTAARVKIGVYTHHGGHDIKKQEVGPFRGIGSTVQKWLRFLWQPVVARLLLQVLAWCVSERKTGPSSSRRTKAQKVTLILGCVLHLINIIIVLLLFGLFPSSDADVITGQSSFKFLSSTFPISLPSSAPKFLICVTQVFPSSFLSSSPFFLYLCICHSSHVPFVHLPHMSVTLQIYLRSSASNQYLWKLCSFR